MRYLYGYTVPEVRQVIFKRAKEKGIPVKMRDLYPQGGKGISHEQLRQAFFDFRRGRIPPFFQGLYPAFFKLQSASPPSSYALSGIPYPGGDLSLTRKNRPSSWVYCPSCSLAHARLEAAGGKCLSCDTLLFPRILK